MNARPTGLFHMDHARGATLRARDLRERWRDASLAAVWLHPGDWYHPAVDAVTEAVEDGRPPLAAVERLGAARGRAGVGLGEALDDLACLYDSVERSPDLGTVRALAVGWVAGYESTPAMSSCTDPATGLPTRDYLGVRLRETYAVAQRRGQHATTTHCLVVVDVAVDGPPWQRAARAATTGRTLAQVFGDGHPTAALGDGVLAVLCERGPATAQLCRTLRRVVERTARVLGSQDALRRPPRVWVERLPERHDDALTLLAHLAR